MKFMKKLLCNLTLSLSSSFAFALTLTGTVDKSNKEETVSYDLILGGSSSNYTVKGSVSTRKGLIKSGLDFGFIRVTRNELTPTGLTFARDFANNGKMVVYMRERQLKQMNLAGLSADGTFVQGYVDDGIFFKSLKIDGQDSSGVIDYNDVNGHYNAKDCSFGSCKIMGPNGIQVMDYDGYWGKNSMVVDMIFGSLQVEGNINFADTVSRRRWQDSDGDWHDSETVIATKGSINFNVNRADGSPLVLEPLTAASTGKEDADVRKLIAFLELFCFDMFAE